MKKQLSDNENQCALLENFVSKYIPLLQHRAIMQALHSCTNEQSLLKYDFKVGMELYQRVLQDEKVTTRLESLLPEIRATFDVATKE